MNLVQYFIKGKNINIMCFCNKRLWGSKIIVIQPCEHLIHFKCLKNIKTNCPLCNIQIKDIYSEEKLMVKLKKNNNLKLWQQYIDVLSVKGHFCVGDHNFIRFLTRFDNLINTFSNFITIKTNSEMIQLYDNLMKNSNVKLKVIGKNKILNSTKIIISNHTNYLDGYAILKLFDCHFLASSVVNETQIGRRIAELAPLLIINRGETSNTVDQMKDFLKKGKSLCIFPEGMLTHPKVITRFRTGAFRTGFPVQPLIIKYDPPVHTDEIHNFIYYLTAQKQINITVTILDPVYPPFNDIKIEKIRHNMASTCDLLLSRVSNRGLKDD